MLIYEREATRLCFESGCTVVLLYIFPVYKIKKKQKNTVLVFFMLKRFKNIKKNRFALTFETNNEKSFMRSD